MKLRVLVHPAEEGGYWAEIPALSGCVSEGETYEETMANILEAAQGWLAVAIEQLPSAPVWPFPKSGCVAGSGFLARRQVWPGCSIGRSILLRDAGLRFGLFSPSLVRARTLARALGFSSDTNAELVHSNPILNCGIF